MEKSGLWAGKMAARTPEPQGGTALLLPGVCTGGLQVLCRSAHPEGTACAADVLVVAAGAKGDPSVVLPARLCGAVLLVLVAGVRPLLSTTIGIGEGCQSSYALAGEGGAGLTDRRMKVLLLILLLLCHCLIDLGAPPARERFKVVHFFEILVPFAYGDAHLATVGADRCLQWVTGRQSAGHLLVLAAGGWGLEEKDD